MGPELDPSCKPRFLSPEKVFVEFILVIQKALITAYYMEAVSSSRRPPIISAAQRSKDLHQELKQSQRRGVSHRTKNVE